jgi:hypothetical protein
LMRGLRRDAKPGGVAGGGVEALDDPVLVR